MLLGLADGMLAVCLRGTVLHMGTHVPAVAAGRVCILSAPLPMWVTESAGAVPGFPVLVMKPSLFAVQTCGQGTAEERCAGLRAAFHLHPFCLRQRVSAGGGEVEMTFHSSPVSVCAPVLSPLTPLEIEIMIMRVS